MALIFQIDGEKGSDIAFLGNYTAETREEALAMAQRKTENFYERYVIIAILRPREEQPCTSQ